MKKIISSSLVLSAGIFMSACTADNEMAENDVAKISQLEEAVAASELTIESLEERLARSNAEIKNYSEEFSYVSDLTEEELRAYEQFQEDYDSRYLEGVSPESIVLIYYDLFVMSDWEGIYELTYDDGSLPEKGVFNELFYAEEYHQTTVDAALDYRYYDSIESNDEPDPDEDRLVEISVSIGNATFTTFHGLRMDNDVWKLNIMHLLESDS